MECRLISPVRSRHWRLVAIGLIGWALGGCVTPGNIKQASTQHATNLTALSTAAAQYRTVVRGYYDDLIAAQRQAYVAQHLGETIDKIAATQYASVDALLSSPTGGAPLTVLPTTLPDKASLDFIASAARIRDEQGFWVRNFQLWLDEFQGASLKEKRAWLTKQVNDLAASTEPKAVARRQIYATQAARSEEDLAYVDAAASLRQQAAELDKKLEILVLQLKVMQAFHGVVDEYLSIDATIDGKAIAQAAAAGAALKPTDLPDVSRALSGK